MAYPVADSYAGNGVISAGRFAHSARGLVENGAWCWFSDPRAVSANGATYIGFIDNAGSVCVAKYDHATKLVTSYVLHAGLEIDDHDNVAVMVRSDGRIVCFYCKHNTDAIVRYRVSLYPHDISTFSAEQTLTAAYGNATYANPHYLSQSGKTYVHYRAWGGGGAICAARSTVDFASWSAESRWIQESGQRPYVKSISNGIDRIDFLLTNCHPNEGQSSVYHCYMRLDSGVEKFYRSNGDYIGLAPVAPAACTKIYDGASIKGWIWDIAYGADENPRVLMTRFPSTADHRYLYSRFNGLAWTEPTEIVSAGGYLYAGEAYYSGGACFDAEDDSVVYLSKQIGESWEIQKWITTDNGASWVKKRDVTTGSTGVNARPFSPRGDNVHLPVVWWAGRYTTYADFDTDIIGLVR